MVDDARTVIVDAKTVQRDLNALTATLNELGDVDWAALAADDDTPDLAATRVRSLATLSAVLAQITVASSEVPEELLTSMTIALVQGAQGGN